MFEFYRDYFKGNNSVNFYEHNRLSSKEITPFLDAIKARITDMKQCTQKKFIELSVNKTKQDADNLIETIEEQTV